MPYLQLDVNGPYSSVTKQRLAAQMSATYSRLMKVDVRRVTVAIRELGEGSVWRVAAEGEAPAPAALLMLDIRRGRPPEQRLQLARALCAHCVELLRLRADRLNVEFTQHAGDEMVHPALGGYSPEWSPDE